MMRAPIALSAFSCAFGARIWRSENEEKSAYDDIKEFVMSNGYDENAVQRAAEAVASFDEAGDRRQAALHFLTIEGENARLFPEGSALLQTNANASATYFAESDSVGLWGGGRFLGPLHNARCHGWTEHRDGDVGSCAQMCEDMSCKAFSMVGGHCEIYRDCGAVVDNGGFQMYVRNAEGIQPHFLPTKRVDGSSGTFMVTGDWGGSTSPDRQSMHYVRTETRGSDAWNEDHYAQDNVARRMGEVGAEKHPFMVVNAGDNFYWGGINHWTRGGHGVHDHFWQLGFENMYSHPSLKVPWISILGNHDYGGVGCFSDMQAQFDYTSKDLLLNDRWKMPSPYYRHKIDFDGYSLELFMLDTNIEDGRFGARGGGVCQQRLCGGATTADPMECLRWFERTKGEQEEWLPQALQDSTAKWKIIVGHHKPAGSHANFVRSLAERHNVQMVIGSHTHEMAFFPRYNNIQKPLLVVGAGGGAQTNPGCASAAYCGGNYGFSEVEVTDRHLGVKIHEANGATPLQHYICEDGRGQSHPC